MRRHTGIFVFNIIPIYRPGMSNVFDYSRAFNAASLPSSGQRNKQNTFYENMEDIYGDCLSDLDLLYVPATDGDSDYAKINWIDPGNFTAQNGGGGPAFVSNEGFQGNGTSHYLNTTWDPSSNGVNFTLDDASVFMYSNTNNGGAGTRFLFGTSGPSNQGRVQLIKNNGGQYLCAINSTGTSNGLGSSPVSLQGLFCIRRTAPNDLRLFRDGVQVGATTTLATTDILNSDDIVIHANNFDGSIGSFSAETVGLFGLGQSRAGQESALYNAWNTYFTSL